MKTYVKYVLLVVCGMFGGVVASAVGNSGGDCHYMDTGYTWGNAFDEESSEQQNPFRKVGYTWGN